MRQNFLLLTVIVAILQLTCACGNGNQPTWHTVNGAAWGTTYNIKYLSAANLDDSIVKVINDVDRSLSMFNPDGQLSRINAGDTTVRADAMLRQVFAKAQRYHGLSGGMFDPTVGSLVNLWGFGRTGATQQTPDSAAVNRALKTVGLGWCSIDSAGRVTRPDTTTVFDFGAIAKGFGVDQVAKTLAFNGCYDFMVEIGGEVVVAGFNPEAKPWRVQIDSPLSAPDAHRRLCVASLTNCAMATSGNYRRLRRLDDGRLVSHTISPVTGYPVNSSTLSVTVVTGQCADADALATACMAMPLADAVALIHKVPHTSALFVLSDPAANDSIATKVVGKNVFGIR